jgi:carbamoyltransferase
MRVVGISGMHDSIGFKRRELPDLAAREYRIVQGLDSAAALVTEDGVVAAAAEERFTGEKTTGAFPVNAIRYCLREASIDMADVDLVAHGFDYRQSELDALSGYTRRRFHQVYAPQVRRDLLSHHWPSLDWRQRFVGVPHHLAHAASSYYLSGFDEALVVVADGMGETESMTVARGVGRDLRVLRRIPALHSLGTLYGAATLHLGFEFGMDEYKVMGLAPYGDPARHFDAAMRLVQLGPEGSYTVPALAANRGWLEHETLAGTRRLLAELFGPQRVAPEPITQHHMDVAAAIQAALEATLLHVLRYFAAETGLRNLCLAGGVALNCTANGLISRSRMFDRIFIQPAAGDDGSALGAALYAHVTRSDTDVRQEMAMPYWGPAYGRDAVDAALRNRPDCVTRSFTDFAELAGETARLIADGRVVAWYQGRMEFGPRALGNRSILADPRGPGMRDHLNAIVKQREDFRPFAPVVRYEDAAAFFDIVGDAEDRYRHMLFVAHTRPEYRDRLPAVTHVDGTARVQVVRREHNPRLWDVIGAFGERTGIPVLLNTSFNLRGQPIICDPTVALETFLGSRIDRLVLGDCMVSRAETAADRVVAGADAGAHAVPA